MKVKSKVSKMGSKRVINVPKAVIEEFEPGDSVYITKSKKAEVRK